MTTPFNKDSGAEGEHWYFELQKLAAQHGRSVADQDAWMCDFEDNKTPEESFYGEYPEHNPKKDCTKKQHSVACADCPWKRTSAPGWLGASEPGEFLAQADSLPRMPCHLHVNYEADDWEAKAETAPQCAGLAIFMANRCKLPAADQLKLPADRETVFSRPHEFVAHHAGVPADSLASTMIYDLYNVKRSVKKSKTTSASKKRTIAAV